MKCNILNIIKHFDNEDPIGSRYYSAQSYIKWLHASHFVSINLAANGIGGVLWDFRSSLYLLIYLFVNKYGSGYML